MNLMSIKMVPYTNVILQFRKQSIRQEEYLSQTFMEGEISLP